MTQLAQTHPSIPEEVSVRGTWTVQRQDSHTFASIARDQAIEQTVNRATKTSGGLTGISLNAGKLQIILWLLHTDQIEGITHPTFPIYDRFLTIVWGLVTCPINNFESKVLGF